MFVAALLLQLPLLLNPGYFSHDELQWAVFADAGVASPWHDVGAFQYRPLTFSLWMVLSRALFATPVLFHAVLVAWGALNASLLQGVGRGFGVATKPATVGALAFVLTPYAAYTHGWVGCIADLLWLSCALLLVLLVQQCGRSWLAGVISAAFTALALVSKEAAFAIPPLLAVAWWFDGRKSRWLTAMLGAGVMAALYLALRAGALLHAPHEGGQYALSPWHLPLRWLEYQLFPPIVPLLESFNTLQRTGPTLIAGLLWLGLLAALWQASKRLLAFWLLGGFVALLPVLPLAAGFNHYAYGFAALSAMTVAAAWPLASHRGRMAIATFALLTALHGGVVMWRMQQVGRIQAVFSPALADAVRTQSGPLVLQLSPTAKAWIFLRLTHDIPSYDGVAIGDRVHIASPGEHATHLVLPDGRLQPLP